MGIFFLRNGFYICEGNYCNQLLVPLFFLQCHVNRSLYTRLPETTRQTKMETPLPKRRKLEDSEETESTLQNESKDQNLSTDQLESRSSTDTNAEQVWQSKSISSIPDMYAFDSTTFHTDVPSAILEHEKEPVILGVDEAGRGPVLGAMVYGVAYCLETYQEELTKYGFADSKVLKEPFRHQLLKLLHDKDHKLFQNVGWGTRTMTAKDISNGMLRNVSGQGPYNLNEQAHDTTIQLIREVLAKGVYLKKIFVDTVGPPETYQAKLKRFFPEIDITVTKKADSLFPIVSAASVAAKVTRDMNLEWYCNNIDLLKGVVLGSGYPSDPNTSKWLKTYVDPIFGWSPGLTRFSWQTAKNNLTDNKAANVSYEEEFVRKGGYEDIGASLLSAAKKPTNSLLFGSHYVL